MTKLLLDLKKESKVMAANLETPTFYRDLKSALEFSRDMFFDHSMIIRLQEDVLPFLYDEFAHGVYHSKKVAIEAGAIVIKEGEDILSSDRVRELVLLSQFCGLLHDCCRLDEDHAKRGAETSEVVLKNYPLDDRSKELIIKSIAMHEAFKENEPIEDDIELKILSGALYDADKFRWGPDNFSTTLWEICDYEEWSIDELIEKFPNGIKVIKEIESTFRTETGKKYGPEMIQQGLILGEKIFNRLKEMANSPEYAETPQPNKII